MISCFLQCLQCRCALQIVFVENRLGHLRVGRLLKGLLRLKSVWHRRAVGLLGRWRDVAGVPDSSIANSARVAAAGRAGYRERTPSQGPRIASGSRPNWEWIPAVGRQNRYSQGEWIRPPHRDTLLTAPKQRPQCCLDTAQVPG